MVLPSASCVLPAISAEDGGCHMPGHTAGNHREATQDQSKDANESQARCDASPVTCLALAGKDDEKFSRMRLLTSPQKKHNESKVK